jgi:hypothetical protein
MRRDPFIQARLESPGNHVALYRSFPLAADRVGGRPVSS